MITITAIEHIYAHRHFIWLRCRIYHERTRVLKTYFLQFPLLKNSNYIIITHTIYFDKFFANHDIKYIVLHYLYRTNYFVTEIYLQIYLYFVSHTHTHVLILFFLYLLRKVQNSTCVRVILDMHNSSSRVLTMINFRKLI